MNPSVIILNQSLQKGLMSLSLLQFFKLVSSLQMLIVTRAGISLIKELKLYIFLFNHIEQFSLN